MNKHENWHGGTALLTLLRYYAVIFFLSLSTSSSPLAPTTDCSAGAQLCIQVCLNADLDPAIYVNADLDPDPSFLMTAFDLVSSPCYSLYDLS